MKSPTDLELERRALVLMRDSVSARLRVANVDYFLGTELGASIEHLVCVAFRLGYRLAEQEGKHHVN